MELSVIIPTYNRKDILIKCLNALFEQTYPKSDFEVIVIDDGSIDGTESVVKEIIKRSPVELRYFKQENKGPAAARNVGIKNAHGDIALFIGDDIIATKRLVEEHMKWHKSNPENNVAILGFVTWTPEIKVTPFMRWLENGGPQFAYYHLSYGQDVGPGTFYTANISLKKQFLIVHGLFDEDFPYAAYEDTELSYRLSEKGLKVIYNKLATGYHYHPMLLKSYCHRMELVGSSSVILREKRREPGSSRISHTSYLKAVMKSWTYPVYASVVSFLDSWVNISLPKHYRRIMEYYTIKGRSG